MKLALVHDYLIQDGGAEKVLTEFLGVFPEAPIYALLYDPTKVSADFTKREVRTTFLQRLPLALKKYQWLLTPSML